jgi:hypothetical protein
VGRRSADGAGPAADGGEAVTTDRNCLSYWFPKLQAASVPVPRTELVDAGDDWPKMLGCADDPKRFPDEVRQAEAVIGPLADAVRAVASKVGGYPVFLRTGHFSGKHDWSKTCFVPDADSVADHVRMIVHMSEMFGMFGELPYRVWAVREMLPVDPIDTLPRYGDMPLVPEVRTFIRGGKVVCSHPYWPADAIYEGMNRGADDPPTHGANMESLAAAMATQSVGTDGWRPLAEKVAAAFAADGSWSADLLPTRNGWYVTDMAEADRSFHWPGCQNGPEARP